MPGSAAARAMLAVAFVLAALVSIDTARPSCTATAMPGEGRMSTKARRWRWHSPPNAGRDAGAPLQWRLIITVQKVGEAYKASNVEFLH